VQPGHWRQTNATFADRDSAERLAVTRIGPILADAEDRGLISSWFFIRKDQWRLRWLPASHSAAGTVLQALASADESMTWTSVVCELEPVAFGGAAAMDTACALFHADSRHLLRRLATSQPLRRAETSILICSTMLRAAGLDWFEQGDVWARVGDLRPGPPAISAGPERARQLHDAMRTLMTTDTRALCDPAVGGPLSGYQPWIAAFEEAGQALAPAQPRRPPRTRPAGCPRPPSHLPLQPCRHQQHRPGDDGCARGQRRLPRRGRGGIPWVLGRSGRNLPGPRRP
jgi:protein-L-isoaspartate(D-aspartate) O-methyltransferase